jgi:hypothetical protein
VYDLEFTGTIYPPDILFSTDRAPVCYRIGNEKELSIFRMKIMFKSLKVG